MDTEEAAMDEATVTERAGASGASDHGRGGHPRAGRGDAVAGPRTGMPNRGDTTADPGRSARKRQAIIDTATALFLRNGYHSTSMDQIAADAAVSKQTVYKNFADKEQLFSDIVLGVTSNSNAIISELTSVLRSTQIKTAGDLRAVLTDLARRYLDAVLEPHVLALRRLVIAEAERFPDLARSYYEQAPARGIEIIAQHFQAYIDRGMLQADDARLAAAHFAYLALAIPQDKSQFCPHQPPGTAERERIASEAARVFLAAYLHPATGNQRR
jgi:TetR/AcrR family transcriptional regulator, mexJK operon transcriptional repressor